MLVNDNIKLMKQYNTSSDMIQQLSKEVSQLKAKVKKLQSLL